MQKLRRPERIAIVTRTASSLLGHLFTRSLASLMFTNTFTNRIKTALGENLSEGRFLSSGDRIRTCDLLVMS